MGRDRVVLKVFDDPVGSFRCWIKRVFRLHPAFREWRALNRLNARGVRSVLPIAILSARRADSWNIDGQGRTSHRTLLMTRAFEHSQKLSDAWRSARQLHGSAGVRKRAEISAAVADLWATSHDLGYAHPDGHPGNVLVSESREGAEAMAVFVDPAPSHWPRPIRGAVSEARALRSLAMLNQHFARNATVAERLRFWRDYWVRRGVLFNATTERRLLRQFELQAAQHQFSLARRRDRRIPGDGKYFASVQPGGHWKGVVVLSLERRHVFTEAGVSDRSLRDWEALLSRALDATIKSTVQIDGVRFVSRGIDSKQNWARRCFEHCHYLRHRDIEAPLVLGYLRSVSHTQAGEVILLPAPEKSNTT